MQIVSFSNFVKRSLCVKSVKQMLNVQKFAEFEENRQTIAKLVKFDDFFFVGKKFKILKFEIVFKWVSRIEKCVLYKAVCCVLCAVCVSLGE